MKKQLIITTDAETLLKMFEYLKDLPPEMDTEETRVKLLYLLGMAGNNVSISETGRTKEQILSDLQQHYGKILDMTLKDEHDPSK